MVSAGKLTFFSFSEMTGCLPSEVYAWAVGARQSVYTFDCSVGISGFVGESGKAVRELVLRICIE
jgi:hypothetical protein